MEAKIVSLMDELSFMRIEDTETSNGELVKTWEFKPGWGCSICYCNDGSYMVGPRVNGDYWKLKPVVCHDEAGACCMAQFTLRALADFVETKSKV